MFPSTACLVQTKIGAKHAWGFDLGAACSGFTYALTTAAQMVSAGGSEHALVIGADVMSSIIDYTDRTTCVLFGDGAGAVVVEASDDDRIGIIDFENYVDGSGGEALCMPAGGSLRPASNETVEQRLHYVKQDGATVFKFAVRNTEEAASPDPRPQRRQAVRDRPVRVAPGQPADHPVGHREARDSAGEGRHQHRALRQHDGGNDSARAQRRGRAEAPQGRRFAASRVSRRRFYRRHRADAMGAEEVESH